LFPRDVLDEAVEKTPDGPTAWQLNGGAIIEDGQKYMAISHVWSDGTGAGAWDGLKVNKCLYHFFRKLARDFGCEGIWWDTICVPGNKVLREEAVANMHLNYKKAEITFVHDCFLRNLPWINAETACIAILMSPWFSRGWTALELAKSKKVKVAFRGVGRPLIKDLDAEILVQKESSNSPHGLASSVIKKLRGGSIQDINILLLILGSRHTSWARDMAVISALLVGADITGKEPQQDIYQAVLRKVKGLCHAHLFHNLPTTFNGSGWSPASLLNMPRLSIKPKGTLLIGERGEAVGMWKIVVESIPKSQYVWKDSNPLLAAKLRSCLKLKHHILLVEPDEETVRRALLVKRLGTSGETIQCRFVGSVYFNSPQRFDLESKQVTIVNTEENEAAAQDDHKENSEMEGRKGKIEDKHNNSSSVEDREMKMRASEALLKAAKDGNEEQVRQLIDEGADIGSQDRYLRTPTSWAAERGHYGVVELLLQQYEVDYDCMDNASQISPLPVNMNAEKEPKAVVERIVENFTTFYDSKDVEGRTPLLLAIKKGHRHVALLLLRWYETQYNAKPNDDHDRTPLWWAAEKGQEDMVKLLLKTGKADVNLKDSDGRTPLSRAAEKGQEDMVKLLLETGKANVNLKDSDDQTPLSRAAEDGREDMVKLLLETGKADVDLKDNNGRTPLWRAAKDGREDIVKLLLETGKADVDLKDDKGRTPLSRAAEDGRENMVKLLLETGKADVNLKDGSGRTPLSQAVEDGREDIIKLLLETGKADVNSKDGIGRTPLSRAAEKGREDIVKLLLETGKADVDSKDYSGQTSLSRAAENGREDVVKLLLETGKADINSKDYSGRTPLSQAAENGQEDVVKLLLETGKVDVDSKDGSGQTSLSRAAENGRKNIVKLLLETSKADVDLKDYIGRTSLSWATKNGQEDIVKLLLETGKADVDSKDYISRTPLL